MKKLIFDFSFLTKFSLLAHGLEVGLNLLVFHHFSGIFESCFNLKRRVSSFQIGGDIGYLLPSYTLEIIENVSSNLDEIYVLDQTEN